MRDETYSAAGSPPSRASRSVCGGLLPRTSPASRPWWEDSDAGLKPSGPEAGLKPSGPEAVRPVADLERRSGTATPEPPYAPSILSAKEHAALERPKDIERCESCGHGVYRLAKDCPNCGRPDPTGSIAAKAKRDNNVSAWMAFGGLLAMGLLCGGLGNRGAGTSSPVYASPASYSSSDLGPTAAEMEELKRLPNLRGWSDRDKEIVIRDAWKLDRATKAVERRRGY